MLYKNMADEQLLEIIQNDISRLSTAKFCLTVCLVAKIKYLLSLMGEEHQFNRLTSPVYNSYSVSEGDLPIGSGGYNPWAEENLEGIQEVEMFWRDSYVRSDGVYVSGHWVRSHSRYR